MYGDVVNGQLNITFATYFKTQINTRRSQKWRHPIDWNNLPEIHFYTDFLPTVSLSKVTKILLGDLNWWKYRPYFNGASSKASTFTSRFVIWQFWHLTIGKVMVYDVTEVALRYLLSTLLQYVGIMVTLAPFFGSFFPLFGLCYKTVNWYSTWCLLLIELNGYKFVLQVGFRHI